MDLERMKEVLKDEAYVKELLATERPEDVQASLGERGVELTLDEVKQLGETIAKVQKGEITQEQLQRAADGELTEDELEQVAGGEIFLLLGVIFGMAAIVGGTAGGVTHAILTGW